ncbi:ATP-dependent helicase [Plantibacter flavus]
MAPVLVVAGAGSGKTETMASRVVWLLANRRVAVGEILGLTFTRKAAGELAARIGKRIRALQDLGIIDPGEDALFDRPEVSTYNAYANALFRDNALLVGREPESVLLSEASAWRLARRIVVRHGDDRLAALGKSVDQVADLVLSLSHELAEIEGTTEELLAFVERFSSLTELPNGGRGAYAQVDEAVAVVGALPVLLDLAGRYADEKRRQGLVEFSDQVALALAACERSPKVAETARERAGVVLLDEYQDTSVVQTRLLSTLFADHAVMAVGDPHQSIYGWRGASAANLARFSRDFGRVGGATQFNLSTSWRNDSGILEAANVLVRPLQQQAKAAARLRVLDLEAKPGAGEGSLDVRFVETSADEVRTVAEWCADRLLSDRGGDPAGSAAILFRARRPMQDFAEGLAALGVPHHILGLGGLLSSPEIVDVTAALRVIHDPAAGSSLIRLLSGPRWRIGVRDLGHLVEVARYLQAIDWKTKRYDAELAARLRESVADDDGRSIIDALDFVAADRVPAGLAAGFTESGRARLREAGLVFAALRRRAGSGLPDLVRAVERELRLDIEVVANESTGSAARAPAKLQAFQDEIISFIAAEEQVSLGSLLAWIDRSLARDDMGPASDAPDQGAVQLLTIHGSKGLEWDHVVIPRLVVDELPAKPKDGKGWVTLGTLPYDFRGDAGELPEFAWTAADTRKEVVEAQTRFSEELRERALDEERRLAYVAVTRAKHDLLLTGSFWSGDRKRPRAASTYLIELAEAGLVAELPPASVFEDNPIDSGAAVLNWPLDPLGARRSTVEHAAAEVDARREIPEAELLATLGPLENELTLLLEERRRDESSTVRGELPVRIPASRFKEFVTDPEAALERLRRPVPQRPYRQTRLGTRFHSWVEAHYGRFGLRELVDALPEDLDVESSAEPPSDDLSLDDLTERFLASEWAGVLPIEVETEIHVPLGDTGRLVVCKLDAVFERGDRFEIVDWKTGAVPVTPEDVRNASFQLALYRLAYAHHRGIEPERIDAVLYYVSHDVALRPERLYSEAELLSEWERSFGGSELQRSNDDVSI